MNRIKILNFRNSSENPRQNVASNAELADGHDLNLQRQMDPAQEQRRWPRPFWMFWGRSGRNEEDRWEPLEWNALRTRDLAEAKSPLILRILEFGNIVDIIFVITCLISIFLFFFNAGFTLRTWRSWAIIHLNNCIFVLCLFGIWLRFYLCQAYGKSTLRITKTDIVMAILTNFPTDLAALVIYNTSNRGYIMNPTDAFIISMSRIHYLLRSYYVSKYFAIWENELVVGDFVMFLIRTTLYSAFLIHIYACIWHRIACRTFSPSHMFMTFDEATKDACKENSWIRILMRDHKAPLLDHPLMNVLGVHYLVSLYWAVVVAFGLGLGDIKVYLTSYDEIIFTAVTQITAWIYTLAVVNGTLTSLLVEGDTERETFITRRFAIKNYLDFSSVGRDISIEVKNFYDYLWQRRKGIMYLEVVECMPKTMRTEIFYDVNKFVLDQLPLFRGMDQTFMMNLAVYVQHTFHLAGEILFEKDEPGDRMYYVLKGYLEILCDDESRVLAHIRSGSAIGETHLIHPYPHIATVRCGSECDMLILPKSSFKQLMDVYPEHWAVFRGRMQERFDQSELMLSLCSRHNEYPRAFSRVDEKLRPFGYDPVTGLRVTHDGRSEAADNSCQARNHESSGPIYRNLTDFDGLSVGEETIQRWSFSNMEVKLRPEKPEKLTRSLEDEAFKTLEADVMRAGSLAKDLGIPRPPLHITAPGPHHIKDKAPNAKRKLRSGRKSSSLTSESHLGFRVLTATVAMATIWYYLYAVAFRTKDTVIITYVFHITDILFATNFWIDTMQVVVTPQKTLESRKEILIYHLKKPLTYFRFFAFLPWEYVMTPLCGSTLFNTQNPKNELMYSGFKLNRCLEFIVIHRVIQELEATQLFSVIKMLILKLLIATVTSIHISAVLYSLFSEYTKGWAKISNVAYEIPLYWAAQITTSTGFGDMLYRSNLEVFWLVFSLVGGTTIYVYYSAKNAALLANSARRRVVFQQFFFATKTFMKHRKFPKLLLSRVLNYYNLQWRAHEGTLFPTERSVIWDVPDLLHSKVTLAQAQTFCSRVPLVQYTNFKIQKTFAKVLKQYFVPAGETVLYPYDQTRGLFFIVKGFCSVNLNGQKLGTLSDGNYFGLPGLIFGINKEFEIISETNCLFFCLPYNEYIEFVKSNNSTLRDYKLLKGEASFRKQRQPLPDDQISSTGVPIFYEKLIEARDTPISSEERRNDRQLFESPPAPRPSLDTIALDQMISQSKQETNTPNCCTRLQSLACLMLLPTIHPGKRYFRIWTISRTVVAVLSTIFVTSQITFALHPGWCLISTVIFDIIGWLDIYIMLHLGYIGNDGQLITDKIMTAKNYLTGSFMVDFLAVFPFDYFFIPFIPINRATFFQPMPISAYVDNVWIRRMAWTRCLRVLQIYRLFLIGPIIEKFIFTSLTFITLVDVVPVMFLFMHVVTCFLIWFSCNWSVRVNDESCPAYNIVLNFRPISAYIENDPAQLPKPRDFDIFDPITLYVIGLYWTMQTALSVGFGDFLMYDENNIQYFPASNRLYAVTVIILGAAVSVYLGAKLTACMVGDDSKQIAIREQMKVVFEFFIQYKVPKSIQRRVREIYFNGWDKTKGVLATDLFKSLHPALKSDVTKLLYEDHLRKSPLLKNLDNEGIRMLSSSLTEMFFPEGEFIMKQGDLNFDIFMISTGVVISHTDGGQILNYMAPGTIFGEISALFQIQRLYSAVAATNVATFVFKREIFLEFLNMYPDLRSKFENACILHYTESMVGTTETSGIEIVLPVITSHYFTDMNSEAASTSLESKKNTSGASTTRTTMRSSSNILTTGPLEATNYTTFVSDPLRVSIQTQIPADINVEQTANNPKTDNAEDRNNKWWSFIVTFGRISRDEMGLLHIIQERKKCNIFTCVNHPLSPIFSKPLFSAIFLLITCVSCALASFELAFRTQSQIKNQEESEQDKIALYTINIIVEIYFFARFLGNLHLAYFDEEGVMVTSKKTITLTYAKRPDGLILDLVAMPYYFVVTIFSPAVGSMLKGLQLCRIVLFYRYLNETESQLQTKASMIKIVMISIVLIFIFHFCACFWYLLACRGYVCEEDSWMWRAIERIKLDLKLNATDEPPEISLVQRYFLSVFYVSTAITFTGLNYVEPAQVNEILLTVCFIFTTVFLIGFLVGEITQSLASQVSSKIHYEHQLSVVQSHFANLGLRKTKLKEVHNYYKLLWKRCSGIPYSQLFIDLPYSLKADIAFAIYGPNIKSSKILGKIDDTIVRQLSARILHELYLPGCRVVRGGDVCDAMYFIKRGEIITVDETLDMKFCLEILGENQSFGEVKLLLPKERYRFSYIARSESEVGVLRREDVEDVLSNYPVLQADLMEKSRGIKTRRLPQSLLAPPLLSIPSNLTFLHNE